MIYLRSVHFIVCKFTSKENTTNNKLVNDVHDDIFGEKCTEVCNFEMHKKKRDRWMDIGMDSWISM